MSNDGTHAGMKWLWIISSIVVLAALVWSVVPRQRYDGPRPRPLRDLREIVYALHDYAREHHNTLPPVAVFDKNGQPLLSWRVLILPYLEEADLFKQFNLDEPWDSPNNIKLLPRMPKVYAPVRRTTPEPFCTFHQVFVGNGAAFEGAEGIRWDDFPDGPSETILVAEAEAAVPWTKPDDLAYSATMPVPSLGGTYPDIVLVGMADGAVRSVSRNVSEASLRAAITRNGDDELGPDF